MRINRFAIFFTCLIFSLTLSFAVPLPTSNSYLLSNAEQKEINDVNEEEPVVSLNKKDVPVLNLNWFDYMNTYFTKYVTIRVIDVYAMQEYYVQRLGGYNHADVQVIDKANLETFKKIYGGAWSWARRPVWVEIDGKFYAGSTNGMPHGFDILQTGEGGHTCIHFLMSKTHGTKKVDPDHQSCVDYAYKNKNLLVEYLNKNKKV